MRKNIGTNKRTTMIVSIIIGIIITLLVTSGSPIVRIAFTEPEPTQEEYDILKGYALQEAQGVHVNVNEDIKIAKGLEENVLKIRIETSRMYGIEARFTIDEANMQIKNGSIEYKGIIDYNNATYIAYTYVKSRSIYIMQSLLFAILVALEVVFLLNLPKLIKKTQSNKNTHWPKNALTINVGAFLKIKIRKLNMNLTNYKEMDIMSVYIKS